MHHAFKAWCIVSTSGGFAKSVTVVDTISATVIFISCRPREDFCEKRGFSRTFPSIGTMYARICCGHDEKTRDLAKRQSL